MPKKVVLLLLLVLLLVMAGHTPATAASISPVDSDPFGAFQLGQSMLVDPFTPFGAQFVTAPPSGTPHGVVDQLGPFPTNGLDFAVLTTGNVNLADDANTSGSSGAALGGNNVPGRGTTAYDVSILELTLNRPAGANCLRFDFAFYSDEFPEFVGSAFNDAFIAELDDSTWTADLTIDAPDNFAFDPEGDVISINSTGATSMSAENAAGTTYDGATALLEAATPLDGEQDAHRLYLSIFDQGDQVYDSAVFVDNVRFETVLDPEVECQPGARQKLDTPLIFLPGVGGSILHNQFGELWPRATDIFHDEEDDFILPLRLDANGVGPLFPNDPEYNSVVVGGIIREVTVEDVALGIDHTSDVYQSTIDALEEAGYQEGVTLFPWAYDWRKRVPVTAGHLLAFIDQVRAQTGAEQVDILAHSMGGLVTRAALADPASVGKVRRVATLGTPVLGAPKILGILQYKTPCFVSVPIFGCRSNPDTVQAVVENMPGAYQLMPGPAFDVAVTAPVNIDRDTDDDGEVEGLQFYDQWTDIVSADHNGALVADSGAFHGLYDDLALADPEVDFYLVIGDDHNSPVQIREYESCFLWYFSCDVAYEVVQGNGDGTVPLHAADLHNPNRGFDLRNGRPNVYAHGVSHGDLPKHGAVINFFVAFFSVEELPETNAALIAESQATGREVLAPQAFTVQDATFGLDDTPQPFSGLELETLGPVQALIDDGADGYLGVFPGQPATAVYDTLPGGDYQAIGNTQALFMNAPGSYAATMSMREGGPARLRVRAYGDDALEGQAVFHVDAPAGARLYLDLVSGAPLAGLLLQLDLDGDGVVDVERPPDSVVTGAGAADVQPPQTAVALHLTADRQCEVTLSATDEGGAGVAATYYIVGDGEMERADGPFVVACGAYLRYLSVDAAGNVELVQAVQTVPVDVKPGSDPNSINTGHGGLVPFAILATAGFDPAAVDPATVTLAGAPLASQDGHLFATFEDVNGDGLSDLVMHVAAADLELAADAVEATVAGQLGDDTPLLGVDTVNIVP